MASTVSNTTVADTSTKISNADSARKILTIVNDSPAIVYIALGAAAEVNKGIRLNASGGAYEINETNPFFGEIYGIVSSGTSNVTTMEVK